MATKGVRGRENGGVMKNGTPKVIALWVSALFAGAAIESISLNLRQLRNQSYGRRTGDEHVTFDEIHMASTECHRRGTLIDQSTTTCFAKTARAWFLEGKKMRKRPLKGKKTTIINRPDSRLSSLPSLRQLRAL